LSYKDDVLLHSYKLRLDATFDHHSNGIDYVRWFIRIYKPDDGSSGRYADGPHKWTVNIGGETGSGSISSYDFRDYSYLTIASGAGATIAHADGTGTKTITCSATFDDNNTWGELGDGSVSFSLTLPATASIPDAPVISNAVVTATTFGFTTTPGDNNGSSVLDYTAQRSLSSSFTSVTSWTGTDLTPTWAGLAKRTKYYTRLRERNAIGSSAWSNTLSATTLGEPDAPSLKLSSVSSTILKLALTDPAYTGGGITARETQLSKTTDFATVIASDTTTAPTFSVSRGTTYSTRSRVQNSTGWSAWSATVTATTSLDTPSTPTDYEAHNVASTSAFSSLGTILDNGGAALTQVNYQLNTVADAAGAVDSTVDTAREPLFVNLVKSTTYYYRLRVSNGQLWSGWGSWVSFTTKSNVPSAPQAFMVDSVDDDTVILTWLAPADLGGSNITGYTILVASDKAQVQDVQTKTVTSSEYSVVFDGLTLSTKYYARVYSTADTGEGSTADILSFSTTGETTDPQLFWENVDGVWKQLTWWENVLGIWKQIIMWENVNGIWKNH